MKLSSKRTAVFLAFLSLSFPVFSDTQVSLHPPAWELGELEPYRVYHEELSVRNEGDEDVEVRFISTCGCLSVEPSEGVIAAGEELLLRLSFDASDDRGKFEKFFILQVTPAGRRGEDRGYYSVTGNVAGEGETVSGGTPQVFQSGPQRNLDYYYMPGCRSCTQFLEEKLPQLALSLGIQVNLRRKVLTAPEVFVELEELLAERDIPWEGVPVLVADQAVLQGEGEITRGLELLLKGELAFPTERPSPPKKPDYGVLAVTILAAGLLDGINPCAFTTLIFLLSALAAAGKSRRDILIIGCVFTSTVYLTYYLLGAGFFGALQAISSFWRIGQALRWLLTTALVLLSVLSLVDYHRIRRGRSSEILLQLPGSMKRRIHRSVRTFSRSSALVGSSLIMGFLIAVFELGCTGQIYFPTLTYMIRRGGGANGWGLLALYNAAFILPLALIFFLTYKGLSSEKLVRMFQNHLGSVKLITALLFLVLGFLTIIT